MDQETQKVFSEGEAISDYIKTKAWVLVKNKFAEKIKDLESVRNMIKSSPEAMALEVQARVLAADTLNEILAEVEGDAEKFLANKELMSDTLRII